MSKYVQVLKAMSINGHYSWGLPVSQIEQFDLYKD